MEIDFWQYWPVGLYGLIVGITFWAAYKIKGFGMDPKPLTKQTLFWLAIIIPIFSFFYFGFFAWYGRPFAFNAEGFERFIKISTLPLGLLSLSIPFTAVINNIHRTIQTNKQIEEATKKNSSDLYYSHKKFFFESMKDVSYIDRNIEVLLSRYSSYYDAQSIVVIANINIKIKKYHYLYNSLYKSKSDNYDPSINVRYINKIASMMKGIDSILLKHIDSQYYDRVSVYRINYTYYNNLLGSINKDLASLFNLIGIEYISKINKFENSLLESNTKNRLFSMMDSISFLMIKNDYNNNDFLVTNIYSDDVFRSILKYLVDILDGIVQFSDSSILDISSYAGISLILNDKSIRIFDVILKHKNCFCEATTKNILYMDHFSNPTST
ncbi:hypothetical protein [Morganella morganii]|uniref:hypothetical protein n=1 Tax=Morganella morganii TaxID=582 RepID=UPI003EB8177A